MMVANLFDLTGKVAVVTGALGKGMCAGLACAGATVIVLARDQTKIDHTVDDLRRAGGKAAGISADELDKSALEAAAQHIIDKTRTC
jgi:NAD(P)-dependent dehydrogenase (short-subunit alcohol dehydrogenase family)